MKLSLTCRLIFCTAVIAAYSNVEGRNICTLQTNKVDFGKTN